jgi:hypothetical protein
MQLLLTQRRAQLAWSAASATAAARRARARAVLAQPAGAALLGAAALSIAYQLIASRRTLHAAGAALLVRAYATAHRVGVLAVRHSRDVYALAALPAPVSALGSHVARMTSSLAVAQAEVLRSYVDARPACVC